MLREDTDVPLAGNGPDVKAAVCPRGRNGLGASLGVCMHVGVGAGDLSGTPTQDMAVILGRGPPVSPCCSRGHEGLTQSRPHARSLNLPTPAPRPRKLPQGEGLEYLDIQSIFIDLIRRCAWHRGCGAINHARTCPLAAHCRIKSEFPQFTRTERQLAWAWPQLGTSTKKGGGHSGQPALEGNGVWAGGDCGGGLGPRNHQMAGTVQ